MDNLSRFEKLLGIHRKHKMSNAGEGELAVASYNCNTKLREVKECFVRLVVTKHRLLTAVHIPQLPPAPA